VDAVLAAGGRLLSDKRAPSYWSLIDAEGNVADIATWQDSDQDGDDQGGDDQDGNDQPG
jgi:hypothetical protein